MATRREAHTKGGNEAPNWPDASFESSSSSERTSEGPPVSEPTTPVQSGLSADKIPAPVPDITVGDIRRPGYDPDTPAGKDALSISRDVEALAFVIAAKDTEPPLSIGLFGDWGSGKSFFMSQLRKRVESLSAPGPNGEGSPFCQRIVHIDFNAWHYVGANLWASLVIRVFEGLAQRLSEVNAEADVLERQLLEKLRLETGAAEAAQARKIKAEKALETAKTKQSNSIQEFTQAVTSQLPEQLKSIENAEQTLEATLAAHPDQPRPAETLDLADPLKRSRLAVDSVGAQFRQWSPRRRFLTIGILAALLLAGFAGSLVLRTWQPGVAATLLAALGLVLTFGPAAAVVFRAAGELYNAIESHEQVKGAWEARRSATLELQQATANVDLAREELVRAQRQVPPLYRFIQERYHSPDYRRDLGIVALIQRDFENLNKLLRQPLEDGRPAQVDRIVLYIDDLDRCPPELVVKVLQAVHLLLAFPIFVVVVAVDSRWLVRSLETLTQESPSVESAPEADEQQLPLNYLEKIFQIPYWIRPMDDFGFRMLVGSLLRGSTGRGGQPLGGDSYEPPAGAQLDPAALLITEEEGAFLALLAPLIPTPRAAKRLVNTYRLLRATVPDLGYGAYLGTGPVGGEYRAVILLLGIVAGFPDLVATMFAELADSPAAAWPAFVASLSAKSTERGDPWQRLVAALQQIWDKDPQLVDLRPYKEWVGPISRFSFRAGRLFAESTPSGRLVGVRSIPGVGFDQPPRTTDQATR